MTDERIIYLSNSRFEPLRGHSRAVRIGEHLYISGTTATRDDGTVVSINDHYEQTKYVIEKIKRILHKTGFHINDVFRTRLYVTDILHWDDYAQAHREAFEKIRPASSIVQVEKLSDSRLLVEVEVEAIRGCAKARIENLTDI